MASLKEIKLRIASVTSTEKITSAMKVVSSARLHQAEGMTEKTLAYTEKLGLILQNLISSDMQEFHSPYLEERPLKRVILVPVSSSTGLCGAFNSNIEKEFANRLEFYRKQQVETEAWPVGKKIGMHIQKAGLKCNSSYEQIGVHPKYAEAEALANALMEQFEKGKADRVELIYHHFKNRGQQILTTEEWLPMRIPEPKEEGLQTEYILEPDAEGLLSLLLPKMLRIGIFCMLLDASTSEHAARMLAMQTATDNANDLIGDLTLLYNKTRQQSITNELLDIVGGSNR